VEPQLTQLAAYIKSGAIRQTDVQQDQVRDVPLNITDPSLAAGLQNDLKTLAKQAHLQALGNRWIVLDD